MITMGSFLDDYINGNVLDTSLNNFIALNPQHQLALGMKKIQLAMDQFKDIDQVISEVVQINYKDYAVEEQIIFLNFLCSLYFSAKRFKTAESVLATLKRMVTPDLAPEYQIIPIIHEGNFFGIEGNFKKKIEIIERCLKILGPQSGRYNNAFWAYLSVLCLTGEFEKLEINLKYYQELCTGTHLNGRAEHILLLKCIERGDFEKIEAQIKKIKEDNSAMAQQTDLLVCEKIYQIFIKYNFEGLDEENPFHWILLTFTSLLKREPEKALYWAHKSAEEYIDFKMEPSFFSYYLVRAELANKNINAAIYSLENRKKIGNTCVFDDFFWFRIFHIKGDEKKAQFHFNLFSANTEKFKLENRFDIELRLSPEISLTDIRKYSRNSEEPIPEKNISNTSPIKDKENTSFDFIIGESPAIHHVITLIKKYAQIDTTVLIVGETGTGKELVAKALQQAGVYKNKPYIPINCGAISDHLLQSELFGHKKGAYTGAFQDHKGVFESAGEGIVFLDEIGEISPALQISLLRVLEAREFRPVGGNENIKLKCKIIAATNRNLDDHVKSGRFRQDLQYRLERLSIEIPPLRDRANDIPLLVNYFLNTENPLLPSIYFDDQALQYLKLLPWPGNIRELKNEMEKIRLFYSDKKILTIENLSKKYGTLSIKTGSTSTKSKKESAQDLPSYSKDFTKLQRSDAPSAPLNLNSKFRRLEELKNLFIKHRKLSRMETEELLSISPNTAISYLTILEKENFIEKKTFADSKTQYYEII